MALANRYVLDGLVEGELDTTSFTGEPVISLTFDGSEVTDATLTSTSFGHEVTAALPGTPDRASAQLRLIVPRVGVPGGQTPFAGLAIVVESATTVGGPDLVEGVVDSYTVHPVSGLASVVDF
jgi:hypothetical protein